jgi:hypothetical protein
MTVDYATSKNVGPDVGPEFSLELDKPEVKPSDRIGWGGQWQPQLRISTGLMPDGLKHSVIISFSDRREAERFLIARVAFGRNV